MRFSFLLVLFIAIASTTFAQTVAEKQRQFDFWIGEWDVNLRVRQKDFTWQDKHKSVARIYPILGGKAILELWSENETGLNGYSLRYYNSKKGTWDLWLNWAGRNQSGTNGMECIFRHKRAECYSKRKINESTNLISRYTFSDAQPNSVRWDDAYSRDEGKTWSNNWIMEFTRRQKTPPPLDSTPNLLTFFNGNRCPAPQFAALRQFTANHKNRDSLKLYNILDGCIVIGFIKTKRAESFFTFTFNSYANLYELAFLDNKEDSALGLYYGKRTPNGYELSARAAKGKKPSKATITMANGVKSLEIKYEGKTSRFSF